LYLREKHVSKALPIIERLACQISGAPPLTTLSAKAGFGGGLSATFSTQFLGIQFSEFHWRSWIKEKVL